MSLINMPRYKLNAGKYKKQAMLYLGNADKSLAAGEPEKAGEFLWGSMAQAIKAVAATRDIRSRRHEWLTEYANSLAKELKDINISSHFGLASYLHRNFYEMDISKIEVARYIEQIKPTIGKLLSLVPD